MNFEEEILDALKAEGRPMGLRDIELRIVLRDRQFLDDDRGLREAAWSLERRGTIRFTAGWKLELLNQDADHGPSNKKKVH